MATSGEIFIIPQECNYKNYSSVLFFVGSFFLTLSQYCGAVLFFNGFGFNEDQIRHFLYLYKVLAIFLK